MKKRSFERVPANINVRFSCCESHYNGTIMNLSEDGMYISTDEMRFPFDSEIELIIPLQEDILNVNVKVMRMTKSSDFYDGLGVKVLEPSRGYINFVNRCKNC
ncbi:MAG: PilZ domain-containing protein [Nitrospiraceae bacterium]|nr:MAG: PilZ domain-containing protein [Nitrospiraceae bacterium]